MLADRERNLSNRRVLCVGGGEAIKEKESGKVEEQVKYNLVSEGYRKQPMLLQYFLEEGANEADKEGDEQDQEEEEEEGESCNLNCDVPVMVFSCYMISLWFY